MKLSLIHSSLVALLASLLVTSTVTAQTRDSEDRDVTDLDDDGQLDGPNDPPGDHRANTRRDTTQNDAAGTGNTGNTAGAPGTNNTGTTRNAGTGTTNAGSAQGANAGAEAGTPRAAGADRDDDNNNNDNDNNNDGRLIHETDYSDENPTPPGRPDPEELDGATHDGSLEVARDAGVGSPLAYARQTVVEVGGTLSLSNRGDLTQFELAPSVGYFLVDGLELTLFLQFQVTHIKGNDCDPADVTCTPTDGQTEAAFAPMLEPSYHLALSDAFYLFGGLGFGLQFARDPKVDFIFRPRVGVDLLVGRSAIFKPAVFIEIGARDGYNAVGLEGSFTAMW